MALEAETVVAILAMALVTVATRVLGAEIMQRVGPSAFVTRFLEGMSSSVLAAVVATYVVRGGWREALAVALAAAVMLTVRNAMAATVVAILAAAAWTRLAA